MYKSQETVGTYKFSLCSVQVALSTTYVFYKPPPPPLKAIQNGITEPFTLLIHPCMSQRIYKDFIRTVWS
jgi:hypothetical protein